MSDQESKEFIRRVLADYEKTENMSASYRAVKATYPEGTECPPYSACVKAYERQQKAKKCGMRNAEGGMQEVNAEGKNAEERTGTVQKIRMLNNLIESLTSVEWTDEQSLLKEIREDYLTALENEK